MRRCAVLLLLAGLVASCRHFVAPSPAIAGRIRFMIESAEPGAPVETLPQSRVRIPVDPAPVLTEADVADVDIGNAELGKGLVFRLTPPGVAAIDRLAADAHGRRIVLVINGVALGALRLEGPIGNGPLTVFVEVPDVYLPRLLATLKPSAASAAAYFSK